MSLKRVAFLALSVCLSGPVLAGSTGQTEALETYDLLFKSGTLDPLPREGVLHYDRTVTNRVRPDAAARDTGEITLGFVTPEGKPEEAQLHFAQADKERVIASFPASVGNPLIMYFMETVMRDMVETSGGSPFYIRNRIKDALIQPADMETTEVRWGDDMVAATIVTLHPFEGDPNADRMAGFDKLSLSVTMSDAVPGWYVSLAAEAPGPDGALGYQSVIAAEAAQ